MHAVFEAAFLAGFSDRDHAHIPRADSLNVSCEFQVVVDFRLRHLVQIIVEAFLNFLDQMGDTFRCHSV